MAKKVRQAPQVQKTGNILRTVLIWGGFVMAVLAGLMLVFSRDNERVALLLIVLGMGMYGFALHDFDLDDDD